MDTIQNNGNLDASSQRSYEPVPGPGFDSGFYERVSDIYLYDLMGNLVGTGEGVESSTEFERQEDDVLVASAAWVVPAVNLQPMEDWLRQIEQAPRGWLTPWREGVPSIEADLWIEPAAREAPASHRFLVAKLDNPYLPGLALRVSLDHAVDRFGDLRKALEQSWRDRLNFIPDRGTRPWLDHLDALAGSDDDEEDEEV